MLFITAMYDVKPEWRDRWLDLVDEFTQATRDGEGSLCFYWARSTDDPCRFFLIEARTEETVAQHLASPLVPKIMREWPEALARTPLVVKATVDGNEWQELTALQVSSDHGDMADTSG